MFKIGTITKDLQKHKFFMKPAIPRELCEIFGRTVRGEQMRNVNGNEIVNLLYAPNGIQYLFIFTVKSCEC